MDDSESHDDLFNIIREIALFSKTSGSELIALSNKELKTRLHIKPLPSHTNKAYRISFGILDVLEKKSYVLKVPRAKSNTQINRNNENHNSLLAYNLGLAPKNLWMTKDGCSLQIYVDNSRNLTPADLHKPTIIKKVADALVKLQQSKTDFKGNFHKPETIRNTLTSYYQCCNNKQQKQLKSDYDKACLSLDFIEAYDLAAVPSHIDLTPENILLDSSKQKNIWFIDWEYSAMASPYWDIAMLCNEADFSDKQALLFSAHVLSNDISSNKTNQQLLINYRQLLKGLSNCWLVVFKA